MDQTSHNIPAKIGQTETTNTLNLHKTESYTGLDTNLESQDSTDFVKEMAKNHALSSPVDSSCK